jgi:general secretion pathway protein E/type IV pilus assembly protein PilB
MRNPFGSSPGKELAPAATDVVTLLNELVYRAVSMKASDIHLEPKADEMRVRYRVDGWMVEQPVIPIDLVPPVVSRLKVLARMDITEKRIPQDGQLTMEVGLPRPVPMRASTFPSQHGEKVVLRLFGGHSLLPFEGLGLAAAMQVRMKELVSRPQGFLVTCGPTGAGKTSTLYAFLQMVDVRSKNVVTLEDPVEVELAAVTQGQIHPRAGFTFAGGLRAILRQDPDVILVGEVRDTETAAIALQAALTGHMVLSTLHTSDTVATIVRLVDLGVEPWIIANALTVILAQRLVRTVCKECIEMVELGTDVWDNDEIVYPAGAKVARPRGCAMCHGIGYRGRTGIFEVLEVDDDLRELIKRKGAAMEFRQALKERNVVSLRRHGLEKVNRGLTTVDEVIRVTT